MENKKGTLLEASVITQPQTHSQIQERTITKQRTSKKVNGTRTIYAWWEEDEWEKLWIRRNEVNFAESNRQFQCPGCNAVLFLYGIGECGHKFCPDCEGKAEEESKDFLCPIDGCGKTSIYFHHKRDQAFQEELSKLIAFCPNRLYGCPCVGSIGDLREHLEGCEVTKGKVILDQFWGDSIDAALLETRNRKREKKVQKLEKVASAERDPRLEQKRLLQIKNRAKESFALRKERLRKEKERTELGRASETAAERKERLRKNYLRVKERRAKETPEERKERLRKDKERAALKKARERNG